METKFSKEFNEASTLPWTTLQDGKLVGTVRSAGGNGASAGNVTFVAVHAAGYAYLCYNKLHVFKCCIQAHGTFRPT